MLYLSKEDGHYKIKTIRGNHRRVARFHEGSMFAEISHLKTLPAMVFEGKALTQQLIILFFNHIVFQNFQFRQTSLKKT